MTHPTRSPFWPAVGLVVAVAATWWWWPSADDTVAIAPVTAAAPLSAPTVAKAPNPTMAPAPATKPDDAARAASAFRLVGTVKAAHAADSFALVRRTADSQLVQLRAGDRIEGYTVRAIESDSVVLAGVAHAVVIETDPTAAAPASTGAAPTVPSLPLGRAPASQEEPAWAGHPAPFGH